MSALAHIPLGRRIPASIHAVSCSLPTMRAVIGYEEKDPAITLLMRGGYPRFVQHPFLRRAAEHAAGALGLEGHQLWLTSSPRAAGALHAWLAPAEPRARVVAHEGLNGVAFPASPETFARAKTFLQHTGAMLSSREAEDYLWRAGLHAGRQEEAVFDGDAPARVKGVVGRAFGAGPDRDVFLTNSGMSAVHAAFSAAGAVQRARGRTRWVQLGWLYLDTIAILQKFTREPARDYHFQSDVFDLRALGRFFAEHGGEIAGVITEVPTNPLIQTPDLAAIGALCRAHGAVCIVDPTIASPLNIDVLPHADLAVNSLTKFAACEGDVIAGAVVVNPASPWAETFRREVPGWLEPPYPRDLARLAAQIAGYPALIARLNRSTPAVVEFLEKHPRVREVFWSLHPGSRDNYLKLARSPDAAGGMVSFAIDGPLDGFYDRVRLPKGASFGMNNSLISPFIYLAHYDLVTSESGRETLRRAGLPVDLLRLSVGAEPVDEIIAALAEALG
ncbi:MAG: PLP-dependent transferase [Opitutaceae bacterium]|jgi:cystathionine gamma-synthase|nr:PLP-dependent transferase [Opitutaceae bacterium]